MIMFKGKKKTIFIPNSNLLKKRNPNSNEPN